MGQQAKEKTGRREAKATRDAVHKTMRAGLDRMLDAERDAADKWGDSLRDGIMDELPAMVGRVADVRPDDHGAALAGAYRQIMRGGVGAAVRAAHTLGLTPAEFLNICRAEFLGLQLALTRVKSSDPPN